MSWPKSVVQNLLPLSYEQSILKDALREWFYTGVMNDLGVPEEICQLCDHPDIRFQFEIRNRVTQNSLLIGSECIKKFDISAVSEDGTILSVMDSKKKVDKDRRKLVKEAQERGVIKSLLHLASTDDQFNIEDFIKYYKKRGSFTPKQLSLLIWRFEELSIPFKKSYFKMTIRRDREKDQLRALKDWQINKLLPCMSASQKNKCKIIRNE